MADTQPPFRTFRPVKAWIVAQRILPCADEHERKMAKRCAGVVQGLIGDNPAGLAIWRGDFGQLNTTSSDTVERGTIDGGCNAWIVANALWIAMSAGEEVGQNILEHWEIDGYDNAAGDSK